MNELQKKYNFISGLPRSGSTLLSSILNQNPSFTAGITDALFEIIMSMIQIRSTSLSAHGSLGVEKLEELARALFESYYSDSNPVVFNTHRAWTCETALAKKLFPTFKMIVCVRDIPWIVDSFERLNSDNPLTLKSIYHFGQGTSIYDRYNMLVGNVPDKAAYIAGPLKSLRQAMSCRERNQLLFVDYESLVSNTEATIKKIYEFIEEPYYEHDFDKVGANYAEYDIPTGMDGMHLVRDKVSKIQRDTVLPKDLWAEAEQMSFWKFDHQLKNKLNWI